MSLHVYKASAGSGKTYRLALSYITLALSSARAEAFKQILAVTFTNKATGEMKDRILSYLYDLAYIGEDAAFRAEVCRALALSEREVSERAGHTLTAILHDYDHFHVVTIDTFLQSLLSSLAYELDLTRGFRVNLDIDDVVSRAVDRLLLAEGRKQGRSGKARSTAIMHFMEDKLADGKGWNIAEEIKQFAAKGLFRDVYQRHEERLERIVTDSERLDGLLARLRAELQQSAGAINAAGAVLVGVIEEARACEGLSKKSVGALQSFALKLIELDVKKDPTKTVYNVAADAAALVLKKYQNDPRALEQAERISLAVNDALRTLEGHLSRYITAQLTLQNIYPLSLLGNIGREVTAIGRETGTFMLSRTPDLFCKMVGREDSSFVFERAGTTLRHVMIDEFQDTSQMQWDIFRRLILENMAQGDEGLIVGDIKQSIYRWRGGDWRILHTVSDQMKRVGEVTTHTLDTNYRSREAILKFNNAFFPLAAGLVDEANADDGYDSSGLVSAIYGDVAQHARPGGAQGGYVRVKLYDKGKVGDEDLMGELYDTLVSLHEEQQIPWREMLVLVRFNAEGRNILSHFASCYGDKVPLTSDDSFALSASPAVMLVIATLKWLAQPADDTTARALCFKTAKLLSEVGDYEITASPDALLPERERLLSMPLYALCLHIIDHYGLAQAEAAGTGQSGYLFALLDNVLTFLEDHAPSLSDFLDYWDDTLAGKSITGVSPDAVCVMTIHKAKGLQRHTVLIPFCHWDIEKDHRGDIIWCEEQAGAEAGGYRLPLPAVPVSAQSSTLIKKSAYAPYYNEEHLNQRIDALNMLYVALTRPETNLFVWANDKGNHKTVKSWLDEFADRTTCEVSKLITSDKHYDAGDPSEMIPEEIGRMIEEGTVAPYGRKAAKQTSNPLLVTPEAVERITLVNEPARLAFRQSNEAKDFLAELEDGAKPSDEYLNKGRVLHYVFSLITTPADISPALGSALDRGLIASLDEAGQLERFIRKRLADERAASWFDGSWTVMSENDILSLTPEGELVTRRPDRVMLRGDETVVVDYKFGRQRPEYEAQVAQYMSLLTRMGRDHVKGYLWYVYKDLLVSVAAQS